MWILARHVICKPFMVLSIPPVIYGMNSTQYIIHLCPFVRPTLEYASAVCDIYTAT